MKQKHRPRVLDPDQTAILENRIQFSKVLEYSLTNLSDGWGISIATLHRYKSPQYREWTVNYSRKNYLSYRKSLIQGVCYRCHEDLEVHPRCHECSILLHLGSPFGHTMDGKSCIDCVESINRQIAKALSL